MKISFKKGKRVTGLAGIAAGDPPSYIKADGRCIGVIRHPHWNSKETQYSVSFMVTQKASKNCPWGWIKLAKKFDNDAEARLWISENWDKLNAAWTFYLSDWTPWDA